MRELPILACDSVAKALWEGKQTQHRVPITSVAGIGKVTEFQESDTKGYDFCFRNSRMLWNDLTDHELLQRAPWRVGDVLYVREACQIIHHSATGKIAVNYRAENVHINPRKLPFIKEADRIKWLSFMNRKGWTGNRNMLKAVARTRLEVNRVWCERIQDISEEDAKAEGIDEGYLVTARGRDGLVPIFRDFWDSLYGKKHPWDSNPWVWACEFEKIES